METKKELYLAELYSNVVYNQQISMTYANKRGGVFYEYI